MGRPAKREVEGMSGKPEVLLREQMREEKEWEIM
jgi:hypothetical protein